MATSKHTEELDRLIQQAIARKMENVFFDGVDGKPFGGLFDEPTTSTKASNEKIRQKFGQFREFTSEEINREWDLWTRQGRPKAAAPDARDVFCATSEGRIIVGEIVGTEDGAEYSRFLAARSLNDNPVERDYGEASRSYPEVWMDEANMRVGLKLRSKGLDNGVLHDENGKRVWFPIDQDSAPKDIQLRFDTVDACFDNLYLYGDIDAE